MAKFAALHSPKLDLREPTDKVKAEGKRKGWKGRGGEKG